MNKLKFLVSIILFSISLNYASENSKVENFKLKDYNGKEFQLTDFKGAKAIVIMFIATQCPVSNDYNSRMAELYNEYKDKGISFIGINSNKQESVDEIKEHAAKNKLAFTILKDEKNVIADKFQASFTPEIYVLNNNFEILYHGRIDDSRKIENVKEKDLKRT
ncbi:MAG: redoxin domain-containing protein, partial [Melioribacteraceae bacterium]|nr:redoxin domain-containing protein [Melioribacteraceae bacterium]